MLLFLLFVLSIVNLGFSFFIFNKINDLDIDLYDYLLFEKGVKKDV